MTSTTTAQLRRTAAALITALAVGVVGVAALEPETARSAGIIVTHGTLRG